MKNILVTGAAGYIGSVLTRQLLDKGYCVRGLDILNFGGESLLGVFNHPNFEFVKGDIRNAKDLQEAMQNIDAVIHLAAIVGDPACAHDKEIASSTNWDGSLNVFNQAIRTPSVKRFVFASTCSNYGKMEGSDFLNEDSPLRPVSLYAELKVRFEEEIIKCKVREDFIPTILRFATVYGTSPRMRFDLTVNEFTRDVTMGEKLVIFGEQFWRPYCHVEDLARGCTTALQGEAAKVNKQVFGVGDSNENYQKKMLVDEIVKVVPNCQIEFVKKDEDPRDYRVDFSKIKTQLGFEITKTVPDGINENYLVLQSGLINNPYDKKYRNV